jgi:hypothetical protein
MATLASASRRNPVRLGRGYKPQKPLPNMAAVRALTRAIEDLRRQHPRFLTREQALIVLDTIERLYRRQHRLEALVEAASNRLRNIEWRTKWSTRIARAGDLDDILEMLLQRRGINGQHIHASAMAKLSAIKRRHQNPNIFRELGLKGSTARWAKARATQAAAASSEPPES